ncbi:MATE family efflux transporter [Clostridium amazonitimonense]|uniref:MATE family efflux transporter n=1 Tax=Clostridium amazonitimonense TaxID=1499689 RepID=UPI000509E4E0|nr:MATE family efflux transporter [Clostridium amazonitimonense]
MIKDLTSGNETKVMLRFAIPMIIGNLFQQLYNVADTIIVGQFIGAGALAAVGSSYTLMVFLTSIILGLCMGSGVVVSMFFGAGKKDKLKSSVFTSFWFIALITIIINVFALVFIDEILHFIKIPAEVLYDTKKYLQIIFYGIPATFIYNYFATMLRSIGNSVMPLIFFIISAVINIVLDIIFVVPLSMGISGAALATIIAQGFSAVSIAIYSFKKVPEIRLERKHLHFESSIVKLIANYSLLSSIQQSIMNFGILMIQGLVNSFGVSTMAAFAAAVKIDSFAYMPVQDFGNAFSTFIAQNKGAEKQQRIRNGIHSAIKIITISCITISILVVVFAKPLMSIFIKGNETEIIGIGVQYLYIEASFYCLIGYLFMFYGLYRGFGKGSMSIVLTIASLGTRVALAYMLSSVPSIGVLGIWWSIPIGWALADIIGYYKIKKDNII